MYICTNKSFMEKQMNKINTSLALLFISISGAIYAQDIEEIIVTANKSEQTVQEIPMNISVITAGDIEDLSLIHI